MRHWALLFVLVVAVAASCGATPVDEGLPFEAASANSIGDVPTPTPDPRPTESPSPSPSPSPIPTPFPSTEREVRVNQGEDIQIRSLHAISGDVAFLGAPMNSSVELALADFGPIRGFDVTIGAPLDDLCSSNGGQSAALSIAEDLSVVGVIGTSCSGAATAAAPILARANIPMISGSNTSPALTSDREGTEGTDNWPGYFRTAHNDVVQGEAAAHYAVDVLGATTAAAMSDGDPYTQALATSFARTFEALGGNAVTIFELDNDSTDVAPEIRAVAQGEPDVLFTAMVEPLGGFVVDAASTEPALDQTQLISSDGLFIASFLERESTDGMAFVTPRIDIEGPNEITGVNAPQLEANYADHSGGAIDLIQPFSANAYDATTLLLDAIEAVAVIEDDQLVIDRLQLRQQLESVSDVQGLGGTLTCDEFGDCGANRFVILGHARSVDAAQQNVLFEYEPTDGDQSESESGSGSGSESESGSTAGSNLGDDQAARAVLDGLVQAYGAAPSPQIRSCLDEAIAPRTPRNLVAAEASELAVTAVLLCLPEDARYQLFGAEGDVGDQIGLELDQVKCVFDSFIDHLRESGLDQAAADLRQDPTPPAILDKVVAACGVTVEQAQELLNS